MLCGVLQMFESHRPFQKEWQPTVRINCQECNQTPTKAEVNCNVLNVTFN